MSPQRHDPVERLNDHHADDLLAVARVFGGCSDATSERAEGVDAHGIDLVVTTPRGLVAARVPFSEPSPEGSRRELRAAFHDLARQARAALAAQGNESSTS